MRSSFIALAIALSACAAGDITSPDQSTFGKKQGPQVPAGAVLSRTEAPVPCVFAPGTEHLLEMKANEGDCESTVDFQLVMNDAHNATIKGCVGHITLNECTIIMDDVSCMYGVIEGNMSMRNDGSVHGFVSMKRSETYQSTMTACSSLYDVEGK
ncbi:MAG: hypothetical protein JWO15_3566 [Sphingomonadales bacterium]|nr:hypothetical protein [Sphingomonadales bacterium]